MLRDNDELSRTFQNMSLRGPLEQSARGCGAQSAGLAPPEASLLGVWTLSLPVSSRVCVSSPPFMRTPVLLGQATPWPRFTLITSVLKTLSPHYCHLPRCWGSELQHQDLGT